ncbi:MAG: Rieske (2Fe-2S) protein [Methanobacterium sp.]|jgi:nitrite reductase/ring-hydroxylating ferredoxin subunit
MEKACNISDIPSGTMKGFTVNDNYILVANVDGNFYAVDAVCTHMSGFIPVGKLEKKFIISCPTHGAQYDVKTGKLIKDVDEEIKEATGSGASDLQIYEVSIKDDSIFIDL